MWRKTPGSQMSWGGAIAKHRIARVLERRGEHGPPFAAQAETSVLRSGPPHVAPRVELRLGHDVAHHCHQRASLGTCEFLGRRQVKRKAPPLAA